MKQAGWRAVQQGVRMNSFRSPVTLILLGRPAVASPDRSLTIPAAVQIGRRVRASLFRANQRYGDGRRGPWRVGRVG